MNPNDFTFDKGTTPEVENVIRQLYANKHRARFFWGDAETGRYWGDENDVIGTVGKSTGTRPCALLINNARSMGGGAILTACIVKVIDMTARNMPYNSGVLYEHPTFENPFDRAEVFLTPSANAANVMIGSSECARFTGPEPKTGEIGKAETSARRYIEFMQGKRFSK